MTTTPAGFGHHTYQLPSFWGSDRCAQFIHNIDRINWITILFIQRHPGKHDETKWYLEEDWSENSSIPERHPFRAVSYAGSSYQHTAYPQLHVSRRSELNDTIELWRLFGGICPFMGSLIRMKDFPSTRSEAETQKIWQWSHPQWLILRAVANMNEP